MQPSVVVINKQTKQIEYGFQGSVYVQLGTSPTGYESLYIGQECDLSSCGQLVVGPLASAAFVSGIATFEVLFTSSIDIIDFVTSSHLFFVCAPYVCRICTSRKQARASL